DRDDAMRMLLAVLAALVAVPGAAIAQAPATQVDIAPFVAHEGHQKVHLLAMPDDWYAQLAGNVVVIEQSDGFVIVDSGGNAGNGRAVVRYARSLANKPIKAVIITHWHGDHPQGISAIRDAYPNVRIISTRGTEAGILGPASYNIGYHADSKFDRATADASQKQADTYSKLLDDPKVAA